MQIERSSIRAIAYDPSFPLLEDEYTVECATEGFKEGKVDWATYEKLEEAGALKVLAWYDNGRLVGFAAVIFSESLHKSVRTASLDTLFLSKPARKGFAGMRLIRRAKAVAQDGGADRLLVSAPRGSQLEKLCFALGMTQANSIFVM